MEPPSYAPTIRLADIAAHSTGRHSALPAPRRIRVLLNVAGGEIMRGHTVSIGINKLTVSVPSAIQRDQECAVFFGLTIEDQIYSIIGTGRVVACDESTHGGYYAEMDFVVTDKKSRIALEQLFNSKSSNRVQ